MKNYYLLIIWFLLTFGIIDISFTFINASDTILNILGIVIVAIWIGVSFTTKCLTNLKFKKNEKAN